LAEKCRGNFEDGSAAAAADFAAAVFWCAAFFRLFRPLRDQRLVLSGDSPRALPLSPLKFCVLASLVAVWRLFIGADLPRTLAHRGCWACRIR